MLVNRLLSYEKTENGWLLHADTADVLLVFLSDDIVRIRVNFDRRFDEASYTLVTTAWADRLDPLFEGERRRIRALEIPCTETEKALCFETATLCLCLRKQPFSFTLTDREKHTLYRDLPERAFEKDHLGRLSHYSCMDREHDHFFGFGEKTGHLDKKLRRLRMSPKDAIGHDPETGDPMYKHIPFYIRVNDEQRRALGLFYHNSYDCVFDLGQEISGYWERYCYYQTDGGDIDLFLINGPDMKDVVSRYTWLTGRTILPTKQSLGYCMSTMYYAELEKDCDQEIYKVVDKHLQEKIWIDNFWLASGYSSGEEDNLRYTFNWNRKRFPDPEGFFAKMNAMGINVICNLKPGVLKNHPYAPYYEERDAFIKTPEENILKKGTKTVWNDNCEIDGIEDRLSQCDYEGAKGTMEDLKIIHSNMMAYTAVQAIRDVYPNERPYIINRAGFAGIQRYAQVWGGDNLTDWRTVKFNLATIMGMGLSGCANMGCDIGGFAGGAPEGELLLRWIQSGVFQPRFTINSANSDNTVTQPWMYAENLPYVREAYALRYRMLPYLYSLMREASVDGLPVMRPLFLEFPDDPACYTDESLSFLYGPAVLVANVVEKGAKTRRLYLPKGCTWYDMNDRLRAYEGGQSIEVPVSLGTIPMFLRGSAIFCTSEDVKRILADKVRQLDLLIAAEGDVSFTYYDDDGHTEDYKRGHYAETAISVKAGDRTRIRFEKTGDYPDSIERLTLRLVSKKKGAFWVTVDGEQIPRFLVRDNWEESECGWYYELSDRSILVKCPKPRKDSFEIVISTEKFDLIGMADE